MASIRKEITTKANASMVWDALRDVGALHTRLVPGFVSETQLEPGATVVTFRNGMVVRERIVSVDEVEKRVVWSATGGPLEHHNGSAQVRRNADGSTRVIWIADVLPDTAAEAIAKMMDQGMAAMKGALDRLACRSHESV
jgi:polyketide cyclase/dehydrase/lipid transport protein